MSFKYLTNIDLDEARVDYLAILIRRGLTSRDEEISVTDAANRKTSRAVYANICAPHYNACAMDGIAIDAKLSFGASETTPVTLQPGQYTYVDTGDPLPNGCDAVVMIEDVIFTDNLVETTDVRNTVPATLYEAVTPWQHIRQIGEDICAGEMILPSYTKITPAALGAMIASGVTTVSVIKKPVVGIIPTGDEIIPPTSNPKEGEILEFNSVIFSAMLQNWGAEAITYPIVKDDAGEIKEALELAISECDIVLLGAGSSAGREDHSASVIADVGTILHHGLAIKPGKPAILGYYELESKNVVPVLGLPGYPVSGIIVLEQLVRPLIEYLNREIMYDKKKTLGTVEATLSKSVVSTLKYREFVRVRLGYVRDKLIALPLSRGSGVVTSFMRADGILEVPQDIEGFDAGKSVSIDLLRPEDELKKSIVTIGSHDPLIDELADLLRLKQGDLSVSSAHVGSMGGLLAVRRGEAHLAGTHLLDEETGEYNTTFVKKLLPDGGVRLVECVKRRQGLILQRGNPKKITSIADLTGEGIRYVNRQKGSGTRILLDYLCRKENVDTSNIYGYNREEFTHTSVAALIAADSADVGLGVYSAAKMYGLDFMYICDEQYDFLIPDHAWELPMIRELIEILKSDAFRKRLDALGGYTIENPGKERLLNYNSSDSLVTTKE